MFIWPLHAVGHSIVFVMLDVGYIGMYFSDLTKRLIYDGMSSHMSNYWTARPDSENLCPCTDVI
jgi:hypothetical protein